MHKDWFAKSPYIGKGFYEVFKVMTVYRSNVIESEVLEKSPGSDKAL